VERRKIRKEGRLFNKHRYSARKKERADRVLTLPVRSFPLLQGRRVVSPALIVRFSSRPRSSFFLSFPFLRAVLPANVRDGERERDGSSMQYRRREIVSPSLLLFFFPFFFLEHGARHHRIFRLDSRRKIADRSEAISSSLLTTPRLLLFPSFFFFFFLRQVPSRTGL